MEEHIRFINRSYHRRSGPWRSRSAFFAPIFTSISVISLVIPQHNFEPQRSSTYDRNAPANITALSPRNQNLRVDRRVNILLSFTPSNVICTETCLPDSPWPQFHCSEIWISRITKTPRPGIITILFFRTRAPIRAETWF
jgi:hypothetical protein